MDKERILVHIYTGNVGKFVKEYEATGIGLMTQIELKDGMIYYAPSREFREYKEDEIE